MQSAHCIVGALTLLAAATNAQVSTRAAQPSYSLAVASFAPLDSDIFLADSDGSNAQAVLAASRARLQRVVLAKTASGWCSRRRAAARPTSTARMPDGTGLEQLTRPPGVRRSRRAVSRRPAARVRLEPRRPGGHLDRSSSRRGAAQRHERSRAATFGPRGRPTGSWIAFSSDRDSMNPKFTFATRAFDRALCDARRRLGASPAHAARRVRGQPARGPPTASRSLLRGRGRRGAEDPQPVAAARDHAACDHRGRRRASGRTLTSGAARNGRRRRLPDGRIGVRERRARRRDRVLSRAARRGARGEFRSPSWSPDGQRMLFHRDVDASDWPPVRAVAEPRPAVPARAHRRVSRPTTPGGERLAVNDQKAASLRNSILLLAADGWRRCRVRRSRAQRARARVLAARRPHRVRRRAVLPGRRRTRRPQTSR